MVEGNCEIGCCINMSKNEGNKKTPATTFVVITGAKVEDLVEPNLLRNRYAYQLRLFITN